MIARIRNDSVWTDDRGDEILAQGGCVIPADGGFYWYGAICGRDRDYRFYGINCYFSRDLRAWTPLGRVLSPGSDLPPEYWVGRPYVLHREGSGRFVMVVERHSGARGNRNGYAFYRSASPRGPFEFVRCYERLGDRSGRPSTLGDLGAFLDDDGTAYLLYTHDSYGINAGQCIARLSADHESVEEIVAEFRDEKREAASVLKQGGSYYYLTSACAGWRSSATEYRTAASMAGPWSASRPVETCPSSPNSYDTQNDFALSIRGTLGTVHVYCGDRWSNHTGEGIGRYAWYPIAFSAENGPSLIGALCWEADLCLGVWRASV